MRRLYGRPSALALAAMTLGCVGAIGDSGGLGGSGADVIGGRPETGYEPAGWIWRDSGGGLACSGVLIARDAVVTAAHCIHGDTLSFGLDAANGARRRRVVRATVHPNHGGVGVHDIAVLILESPFTSTSLAIRSPAMETSCRHRLVGYGRVDPDVTSPGIRKSATMCVTEIQDSNILAHGVRAGDGRTAGGACPGDSGGPLFREGTLDVVGVLSGAWCELGGTTTFTSINAHQRFIDCALTRDGRARSACLSQIAGRVVVDADDPSSVPDASAPVVVADGGSEPWSPPDAGAAPLPAPTPPPPPPPPMCTSEAQCSATQNCCSGNCRANVAGGTTVCCHLREQWCDSNAKCCGALVCRSGRCVDP